MANVGRPAKYKTSYCQELIDSMANGETNTAIMAKWNISDSTFYEWVDKHKEFKEAYEIGLPKCAAAFEKVGIDIMTGKIKGDAKVWKSFMANKFRKLGWSMYDKPETQISIGNMNVLNQYANKPVEELKNLLLEKLGDQGLIDYQSTKDTYDHTQDDENKT